jgi:hypothetical protein
MRLHSAAEHADQATRNNWLTSTVQYQQDMRFPMLASDTLMNNGAQPASNQVLRDAIYAEEYSVVERLLDSCKNAPAVVDDPKNSVLSHAITCGFAAEQKRVPIIALLVERGAKVTKSGYGDPMPHLQPALPRWPAPQPRAKMAGNRRQTTRRSKNPETAR